jgi:hypothetical protein
MTDSTRPRPEFSARPPDGVTEAQWAIRRVGPDKPTKGVILSHNLVGCYTHFFRGCTVPCPSQGPCEPCANGTPRRWHSWFALYNPTNSFKAIMEITPRVIEAFDLAFRKNRTLRGLAIEMHRAPAKPNGKLYATITESTVPKETLPKSCDVAKHLMRMWGYAVDTSAIQIFADDEIAPTEKRGSA